MLKFLNANEDRRVSKHYLSKASLSTYPPPLLILLPLFMLDLVATFLAELILGELIGLHTLVISPIRRALPAQDNTNAKEALIKSTAHHN
jgi:hypothetical protein